MSSGRQSGGSRRLGRNHAASVRCCHCHRSPLRQKDARENKRATLVCEADDAAAAAAAAAAAVAVMAAMTVALVVVATRY